ncbi:MAG: flagellar hook-basal body protein [Armatimonadetes bacterium]|nr:flagellar hook-basal body complex protein [Armatimonadota bacterium]MBS1704206.1 flagellar hook-basal body protein [Armatimonadota bacterium]
MNRGIYTGARGMMTTTQWMDVISNNLANSGTDGYKADTLAFTDVMMKNLYANGGKGVYLGSIGNGPAATANSIDRSVGTIRTTGNALDVALRTPQGMFAVQMNGQTYYTRNGSFSLDSAGHLVTNQGLPVLDTKGSPITITGKGKVMIDEQGLVHQGDNVVAQIGIYESDFAKAGLNLWTAGTQTPQPVANPELATNSLEASNVEPIQAMVDLIKVQRSFEESQRSIQTQDDMTGKLFEILNRH